MGGSMRTKMLFLKRIALSAMIATALPTMIGCGGGGSSSGGNNGGGWQNVTLQPTGVWSGSLGGTPGDVFDMRLAVNGRTVTGTGRITASGGVQISTGQLAGNYSGSNTSGQAQFTVN